MVRDATTTTPDTPCRLWPRNPRPSPLSIELSLPTPLPPHLSSRPSTPLTPGGTLPPLPHHHLPPALRRAAPARLPSPLPPPAGGAKRPSLPHTCVCDSHDEWDGWLRVRGMSEGSPVLPASTGPSPVACVPLHGDDRAARSEGGLVRFVPKLVGEPLDLESPVDEEEVEELMEADDGDDDSHAADHVPLPNQAWHAAIGSTFGLGLHPAYPHRLAGRASPPRPPASPASAVWALSAETAAAVRRPRWAEEVLGKEQSRLRYSASEGNIYRLGRTRKA